MEATYDTALQALAGELFPGQLTISVGRTAEALECSDRQIRRLIQRGQLKAVSIGRKKLVPVLDLLAFIEAGGVEEVEDCLAVQLATEQGAHARDVL